jgi:hypothetical protein
MMMNTLHELFNQIAAEYQPDVIGTTKQYYVNYELHSATRPFNIGTCKHATNYLGPYPKPLADFICKCYVPSLNRSSDTHHYWVRKVKVSTRIRKDAVLGATLTKGDIMALVLKVLEEPLIALGIVQYWE